MSDNQDAQIAQLEQLNARSQKYVAQLWQVPFAYLAVGGVALGLAAGKEATWLGELLILYGVIGCFVVVHMCEISKLVRKAVTDIEMQEKSLELRPTAKWMKGLSLLVLTGLVVFISSVSVGVGIWKMAGEPFEVAPACVIAAVLAMAAILFIVMCVRGIQTAGELLERKDEGEP